VLLSSLLVAVAPVSADDYAVSADLSLPTALFGPLSPAAGFGINDVAQSGDTIWAVSGNTSGTNRIYKSADAGASWAGVYPVSGPTLDGSDDWTLIAVAPDDPAIVALVDTSPTGVNPDIIYLSTTGGAYWSALTNLTANLSINAIAISPLSAGYRYVVIGGNSGAPAAGSNHGHLQYWTQGPLVPSWATPTNFAALNVDDVEAVAFSPNFLADQALMVVTEDVGSGAVDGNVALRVYSYNQTDWDANIDISFPRYLEETTTATLSCARADITLDPSFYLGDASLQVGFIGAQITAATAEAGGVYTLDVSGTTGTLVQPFSGYAVNSVAWDGTNLMAAQRITSDAAQVIWRSANALSTLPVFLQNSSTKTPSTGKYTNVIFAGTSGYAFSQGNNSAVAKTTDLGKSFNGVALVNSNFNNILDFWVSPDASVFYALTDDGVDINLWRKSAGAWERVFILSGQTTTKWLVRADADNPDTVYLGKKGFKNMYYAIDAGEHLWTVRSCAALIQDFAVQDKDVIYVAVSGSTSVITTPNGGFTWALPVATGLYSAGGGNCYSINLLADNNLIVGGAGGGVTYSTDGGATWVPFYFSNPFAVTGNVLATATGLEAGDVIFVASSAASQAVKSWTIGTSLVWDAGTAAAATGMAYEGDILYVFDNTANVTYRMVQPAWYGTYATDTIAIGGTKNYSQTNMINALQTTTGASTTLWARNETTAPDTLDTYTEYFTSAGTTPTATYPVNGAKIPVNSISGSVSNFVFQWNAPPAIDTFMFYDYNLQIYLDEAGTIPVAGSSTVAQIGGAGSWLSSLSASASATNINFTGVPGETYYWRVRVDAGHPLQSYWSAMESFTIQQLSAIVPTVSSPSIGAVVNNLQPAFSWSPIAGATMYKFELSTNAAFVSTVYDAEVPTAGAQLPSVMMLERGKQYYWRVKAIAPSEGEWSTVANFVVAEEEAAAPPPVVVETTPAPVITIQAPPPTPQITLQPPAEEVIAPAYIWAIIIIGAVLVIAVIVLIVRTRRSV